MQKFFRMVRYHAPPTLSFEFQLQKGLSSPVTPNSILPILLVAKVQKKGWGVAKCQKKGVMGGKMSRYPIF